MPCDLSGLEDPACLAGPSEWVGWVADPRWPVRKSQPRSLKGAASRMSHTAGAGVTPSGRLGRPVWNTGTPDPCLECVVLGHTIPPEGHVDPGRAHAPRIRC